MTEDLATKPNLYPDCARPYGTLFVFTMGYMREITIHDRYPTDQLRKGSRLKFVCSGRVLGDMDGPGMGVIPVPSDRGPCGETKLRPRMVQTTQSPFLFHLGVHA